MILGECLPNPKSLCKQFGSGEVYYSYAWSLELHFVVQRILMLNWEEA